MGALWSLPRLSLSPVLGISMGYRRIAATSYGAVRAHDNYDRF